jgi:hypothetical protein
MTTEFNIQKGSRRGAFASLAALCGAALLVLSGCATGGEASCDEGYICSNFPDHVVEVIQKLDSSSFGCENPRVYLENHSVNFKSPNGPDSLRCNYYFVDANDRRSGEKFNIFESASELNMYYSDACDVRLNGLYMGEWLVSPNVAFMDIQDQASANEAARALGQGFVPVEVKSACDAIG